MENINWHLLPAEELDKKVDEYLAGNEDISDQVAQQILLRHAELVKRGAISPTEGYLARKKSAQRVMVPNTNFLKQVLKQTVGVAASESRSAGQQKRARSASESEEEPRAAKRHKHDETRRELYTEGADEQRIGPQPARVMRGRGSSGASVLDAVFGSEEQKKKTKDKKTKHKKRDKKHKKDKKHKRDKKH